MTARRLIPLLLAAVSAAVAAPAPPAAPALAPFSSTIDVNGANINHDFGTGETVLKGGASCRWTGEDRLLTADEIRYVQNTETAKAIGRVTYTFGDTRLLADTLEFHHRDGTFKAEAVRIGRFPFYIEGESAEGNSTKIVIHNGTLTYTDPGAWKPSVKADTIVFSPGHYIRLTGTHVGLYGEEVVPLGGVTRSLSGAVAASYFTVGAGYRSTLGPDAELGVHIPVLDDDAKVGGDIGYYEERGLMAGPSGSYSVSGGGDELSGSLQSGFIEDHGDRLTDVDGNPIPESRGYVEWQHQQEIGDNVTIDGDINYWSDSDIIRDFQPEKFVPVQNPDSYLEAVYAGQNDFASVFARFQPNTWEAVEERLPEVSYDLAPTAIGDGFYERLDTSAVSLLERPPGGGPELASDRLDAFYGLSRPIDPTSWFDFTPVAGARVTDYMDTQGAAEGGGTLRTLGEIGFDSQLRSSGTFDYQNPTWDIDGLRHLLTPTISYRYIPEANAGQQYIPDIDGQTFTTYLTPLELGDITNIDQLEPENTLRLGLNNTLQTKADGGYGSRDLVTFNLADDLNFHRTAAEPDFSDVHTEFALTPAPWLEYSVEEIFSPESFTLREFDSNLVLRDGNVQSIELANDFLRHEDDDYLLDYRRRINERFQFMELIEYGARQHRLNTAETGITQNLANVWQVEYLLTLNGGPNREGHFGFQMVFRVLQF